MRSLVAGLFPLCLAVAVAAVLPACADTSGARAEPAPRAAAPWIDVQLSGDDTPPAVGCDGRWLALDRQGQQVAQGSGLSGNGPPTIRAGAVTLDGHDLGPPPVVLQAQSHAAFTVDGKLYRGDIVLDVEALHGLLRIVNRLLLEDYLLGVVPGEMPDRFGLEALKAQAVAARSYALSEREERGFVYSDTRSQMYGGRSLESALATRAVRETAGQVLVSRHRIVRAWYHSTCGGHTAPAGSVFPDNQPGVMDEGVACPDCRLSPYYAWTRRFDASRVCAAAELPTGKLQHLTFDPATLPGRPDNITLSAGSLDVTLPMLSFRERISAGRPLAEQLPSTQLTAPPRIEEGDLVLEGRGWGHGVGLCQYGASGFAARGATYEAILARYYPGAELAPIP